MAEAPGASEYLSTAKADISEIKNMITLTSHTSYDDLELLGDAVSFEPQLQYTEFYDCTFTNCKFAEMRFFACIFENCSFHNCDLSSATLKQTSFRGVTFIETKLTGIEWSATSVPLDVNFRQCILNYSGFIGVDLRNAEMSQCQLKEVDFTETNLSKADCRGSDFTGARFVNTNLTHTDLRKAVGYAIHPAGNILRKTKFSLPEAISLLDAFDIVLE
jgi:uncharacterized protein YjbI with pentapeptide repeats